MVALPRMSLALAVSLTACSFGEDGIAPALELGELPQDDAGEAEPVDEPFEPGGGPGDDPGGPGDGRDDDGDGGDGGAPGEDGGDGDPDPDDGGSADDGSVGDDDDDDDDDGEDDGSTDPQPNCDEPIDLLVWAEDADVAPPMTFGYASEADGEPAVAYSSVAEEGTVTFELDVPCAGTYNAYGLVWDALPGAWSDPDADSLYFDVEGSEVVWRYGCQTLGLLNALSWQPLAALQAQPCAANGVVFEVEQPGTYTLSFRNREEGSESMVAAIAALALSTDPDFDPYSLYTPY